MVTGKQPPDPRCTAVECGTTFVIGWSLPHWLWILRRGLGSGQYVPFPPMCADAHYSERGGMRALIVCRGA